MKSEKEKKKRRKEGKRMIESTKKAYILSQLLLGKDKIERKLLNNNLSLDQKKKLKNDLYLLNLKISKLEKQVRAQFA